MRSLKRAVYAQYTGPFFVRWHTFSSIPILASLEVQKQGHGKAADGAIGGCPRAKKHRVRV